MSEVVFYVVFDICLSFYNFAKISLFSIKRTQFSYSVEKKFACGSIHITVSGFISDSEIAFNKVDKITLCVFSLSQTPFES